ncbi:MAG TPA: hypothetical protein VMH83_08835 [Candidatus Acidoferrum sp.]|nr:hypothetical protein [Candidatus Acidoferrum sp.]
MLRKSRLVAALLITTAGFVPVLAHAALFITIVQGLSGQPQYEKEFGDARQKIETASHSITDNDKVFSFAGDKATRAALLKHFADLGKKMGANDRAAIYLIGHGSFDGDTYKFNIPGPDLTGEDLKGVLEHLPGSNHVLVSTGSASGAMVETITGTANIRSRGKADASGAPREAEAASAAKAPSKYLLISGTRNGNERNATQFARFFADALSSKDADVNKNNSISVQEAFDYADKRVSGYFQEEGKLATEHAQLRGDGAAQLNLSRLNAAEQKAELANASGKLQELLKRRQQLDAEIEDLQVKRGQMSNADYVAKFQQLVLQSAELNEQIDAAQKQDKGLKPAVPAPVAPPIPESKSVP